MSSIEGEIFWRDESGLGVGGLFLRIPGLGEFIERCETSFGRKVAAIRFDTRANIELIMEGVEELERVEEQT